MIQNGWVATEKKDDKRRVVELAVGEYEIVPKKRPLRDPLTGRVLKGNPYDRPFGL
jgi:hypothetical protein